MEKYTIEFLCSSNFFSPLIIEVDIWLKIAGGKIIMDISVILQHVQKIFCYVIMYMSEDLMHD